MNNELRFTYMSNGMLDIRGKNGRIRQNAIIQKEELALFILALNYCINEMPYNTKTIGQYNLLFDNHVPTQIADLLKLPLHSDSFKRILEQTKRTMFKLAHSEIEERSIEESLDIPEFKSDLNVLLTGRTGVGKSTTIKSCSAIPDEINFPVVNTNRTTTFPTEYVLSQTETYNFMIEFQSQNWVAQRLEEALSKMIIKYTDLRYREGITDTDLLKTISSETFIEADEQNLFLSRLILGKYKKEAKTPLHSKLNEFWNELYQKVENWVEKVVTTDQVDKSASPEFLLHQVEGSVKDIDLELIDWVIEITYQRAYEILQEADNKWRINCINSNIPCVEKGLIVLEGELVGFHGNYDISNIWETLRYFFSRDGSDNGKAITPFVKRAKVILPYNKSFTRKYPTISLHDIIGYGHTNSEIDSGSLEGSTSINYLNYDAIVLLERSDDPMNEVTQKILGNLLLNAMKKKIIVCYSHYHRFTMNDWDEETYEEERQHQLIRLQQQALKKLGEEHSFIRELNELRTLFLEFDVQEEGTRRRKRIIHGKHLAESFISKIVEVVEEIQIKQNNLDCKLNYDFRKLVVVYQEAVKVFLENQQKEYETYPPHWKTTEALTNRLRQGETYFHGSSRILKPIDDYHFSIMKQVRSFIENPIVDTNLNEEKIDLMVDVLKENVSQALKEDIQNVFLNPQTEWQEAYMYSGTGSDKKRRRKILDILEGFVPRVVIKAVQASDYWIQTIERRITDSLLEDKTDNITENNFIKQ